MNELFKKYDGLLLPATGGIAPLFNSSSSDKLSNEYLLLENHMVIGNFGGYPSITIPYGKINNMPVGINLTCGVMKDALTLNIANKLEELIKYDGGEYHV
jgi:aspartyl-tRNA(Asn)/glutamyl-tRNA(Gln) amidotransferase subunit A